MLSSEIDYKSQSISPIYGHFHQSVYQSNENIKDGGMFSLLTHVWVGQEAPNNPKMRMTLKEAIFNVDKILKILFGFQNLVLPVKGLMF